MKIYKLFLKRVFGFIMALIALLILSPLLIPVCIGLLLTGEHYVFYFQERVGHKNQAFNIWKFATMLKNSPSMGTGSITLRNDPRVLPMGTFLRKTKINELPQLINVLKGDMSFVGPRPLMEVDFVKYPEEIQPIIYNTKPGITGIASIIFSDEEKFFSESKMDPHEFDRLYVAPYKGELEAWYQNNLNLITDIKLLFLTAWTILQPATKLPYKFFKDLPKFPENLTSTPNLQEDFVEKVNN